METESIDELKNNLFFSEIDHNELSPTSSDGISGWCQMNPVLSININTKIKEEKKKSEPVSLFQSYTRIFANEKKPNVNRNANRKRELSMKGNLSKIQKQYSFLEAIDNKKLNRLKLSQFSNKKIFPKNSQMLFRNKEIIERNQNIISYKRHKKIPKILLRINNIKFDAINAKRNSNSLSIQSTQPKLVSLYNNSTINFHLKDITEKNPRIIAYPRIVLSTFLSHVIKPNFQQTNQKISKIFSVNKF